jgi:hypothetical protein
MISETQLSPQPDCQSNVLDVVDTNVSLHNLAVLEKDVVGDKACPVLSFHKPPG